MPKNLGRFVKSVAKIVYNEVLCNLNHTLLKQDFLLVVDGKGKTPNYATLVNKTCTEELQQKH